MPPRDGRALLADIAEACAHIREVTHDRSLDNYVGDWKLRAIVERQFITIGEAVGSLLKLDESYEARISHCRRIIDFRNILVHGYSLIDHRTAWGVIERDVGPLAGEVDALLRDHR
jgi:uncharacterized protein with HEPN domain